MEQDLVQATEDVLNRLFQDRLSERDKLALENWLRAQLEKERRCWKDKLKLSFMEVEKERKLAMDAHTSVHVISDHVESLISKYDFEIPQEYEPVEHDNKVSHIDKLYRNVDAILDHLARLVKDRRACLQFLNRDVDSHDPLFPVFLVTLDELKQTIQDTNTQANIREEDLRTEMSKLREELDIMRSHHGYLMSNSEPSGTLCDADAEEQEDTSNTPATLSIDVGTQVETDDICGSPWPGQCDIRQYSTVGNVSEADDVVRKSSANSSGSSENEATVLTQGGLVRTHLMILPKAAGLQTGAVSPGAPLATSNKARNEVRMSSLRKAASDDYLHLTLATKPRRGLRRPLLTPEYQRYSDGYLSGVRKEIINTPSVSYSDTHSTKQVVWRRTGDSKGLYNTGNRCLRCHKLYSVKDNHKMACRYHPKGKRKLEKYDARGRLSMVTYIWECCMQRPEATGCSTGEHI